MSSVAQPGLLSSLNAPNIQLVRNLGREGVVRVGGIVADFTSYSDTGTAAAEPKRTVITRACLQQLRGFLDAVGWTAIWSVNFGRGTLEQALVEVRAVKEALGDRLLAIELGNEVENYGRGAEPLRKPPYVFAEFRAEYDRWRSAILTADPRLSFAAPDTAGSVEWVEQIAADARGDVQLLTTHYYRGGQKQATLDQLMSPDPGLTAKLERLHRASMRSGVPWRMCETNSFFGGGRPGLSDTFAASLWTLDYMLLLAQSGCAGVNIETGFNQLGFLSSYSPIRNDKRRAMHSRSELLRNACIRNGQKCEFRRLSSPLWSGSQTGVLLRSRTGTQHPVRCTDQQDLGPADAYLTVGRAPS